MGKKLVMLIVLGLVLGIIFLPQVTKRVLTITGKATVDTTKDIYHEISGSPEIQEKVQQFKQKVNDSRQST